MTHGQANPHADLGERREVVLYSRGAGLADHERCGVQPGVGIGQPFAPQPLVTAYQLQGCILG